MRPGRLKAANNAGRRFGAAGALLALLMAGPAAAGDGVNHVVLVWLKDDVSAKVRDRLVEQSRALADIEQVRSVRAGGVVESDRAIVDDSFDFGIYMRFDSVEDMNAYLMHPRHVEFVDTWVKPNVETLKVYDF